MCNTLLSAHSAVQLLECNVQCNCSSAICQCTSLTHFGLYQHPYTSLGITSKSKKMFWGWVQYFWKYSFSRTVISCLRLNWPSASGPVLRHYLTYSPILHVEPPNGYGLSKFCSWEDRQEIISPSQCCWAINTKLQALIICHVSRCFTTFWFPNVLGRSCFNPQRVRVKCRPEDRWALISHF